MIERAREIRTDIEGVREVREEHKGLSVCVCACVYVSRVVRWWCSGKHSVLPSHRVVVQIPPGVKGVCHSLHTFAGVQIH